VYQWTLAMVFSEGRLSGKMVGAFGPSWLPVMVFSKGRMKTVAKCSDVYTVRSGEGDKRYHDWQQPLPPWMYWLERLVPPGALVADPFAGAATIGVAVQKVGGGRTYLGVEKCPRAYRVARGRLLAGDKS
jgi:DNA methylase